MDALNGRCGRCGAPTRTQVVKGLSVQSCVACGAYTVDQLTLERLIGGPSSHWGGTPDVALARGEPPVYSGAPTVPAPPPLPPALPDELPFTPPPAAPRSNPPVTAALPPPVPRSNPPVATPSMRPPTGPSAREIELERQIAAMSAARKSRTTMFAALFVAGAVGLLAIPAMYVVVRAIAAARSTPAQTVPSTELDDVLVPPAPVPEPSVASAPAPPEPQPEAAPAPTSAPAPSRAPAPQGGGGTSVASLNSQGWNQVGSNPRGAADTFQRALAIDATNAEANYGVGYAMLQLRDPNGARPYLCAALRTADIETERDVTSLLAKHGLSCN